MRSNGKRYSLWLTLICQIVVVGGLFVLWEVAMRSGWAAANLYSQPTAIISALIHGLYETSEIWYELGWTLLATFIAFVVGAGAALILGMIFVIYPFTEKVLEPLLAALNAMPRIALAPLLILWFGLGIGSKIALGASLVFFIVLQSVVAGGRSINQDHITLAQTLGLSPLQSFWKITMPTAVPVVFSGLRLGLMYSLLGVVAGEIIAAEHGLGQRVAYLTSSFDIGGVWAVVFVLAAVGMAISWSLALIEHRLLRWR
ncbi:MAG: ABC transporter permease [Rhodocyclales bacterium]|nr:ABC transporter permease [Rhodocyclales bacterium]